jgi:hypothetical protein
MCLVLAFTDTASLLADYLSNNKIDNTVVLTGDIHTHWVSSSGGGALHDGSSLQTMAPDTFISVSQAFELPKFPCRNEAGYNTSSRYADTGAC